MPKPTYPRSEEVAPDRLRPNPWNTNFVSPDNEAKLDASLKRLGLFKEIIVRELDDGDFEILGGQHRWESAIRLGLALVPIRNVGPMDDQRAKEISLIDNARYGADDSLALSDLLQELGTVEELEAFMPYSSTDMHALFSSSDIALDDLELDENFDRKEEPAEPPAAALPKTHTMMRFKVPLGDAERVTDLITRTQNRHGLNESDALTNAGDALVHLLLSVADDAE